MDETEARAPDEDREIQGELEGLSGDPAPGVPPPEPEPPDAGGTEPPAEKETEEPEEAGDSLDVDAPVPEEEEGIAAPVDRLRAALVRLDEKVGGLLERHAAAIEENRHSAERLARLESSGVDPTELEARIDSLESENDQLRAHAAFLEERIRGMLDRVRYVVES